MRSIQARFEIANEKYPTLSSYIHFAKAVRGQKLSRPIIAKWFPLLVEREDYHPKERKALTEELVKLSNE